MKQYTVEQLIMLWEKMIDTNSAANDAEDWYRNEWLNMSEEEQKEYV